MKATLLYGENRTGKILKGILKGGNQQCFRFAVAYARKSGAALLEHPIRKFIERGGEAQGVVGINQGNTSHQGLSLLLDVVGDNLHLRCGRKSGKIFHPKLYFVGKQSKNYILESIIVGSSNLTRGGLQDNEECDVLLDDFSSDQIFHEKIEDYWRQLFIQNEQFATVRATEGMLKNLLECGALVDETQKITKLAPPPVEIENELSRILDAAAEPSHCFFAMMLSHFDTSDKSSDPVILIPIKARNEDPKFWFWPDFFANERGFPDLYLESFVRVGKEVVLDQIRLYDYPAKKEFRLKSEIVKRFGEKNNILVVHREGSKMKLIVVRESDPEYQKYLSHLTKIVSKEKNYGYFNNL